MSPRVSIIIPIYNTRDYLTSCLDSIASQDYSDFECILVDDGSTDGSGLICDDYARKDGRFKVFHKENGGVSTARNFGLEHALGDWVYFVDSDDEILPGGLQALVDCIDNDVDCVVGGYERYGSKGELLEVVDERLVLTLSQEESLQMLFLNHNCFYSYIGYMWLWLFRREIIQEKELRFDPAIKIKEDTLFIVQYICESNGKTRFSTVPVYKYKMRDSSAMGNLKDKDSPDYLTSMDSVIQMHSCIQKLPGMGKSLYLSAKKEVVDRVYMIYARMKSLNVVDDRRAAPQNRGPRNPQRPQARSQYRHRLRWSSYCSGQCLTSLF